MEVTPIRLPAAPEIPDRVIAAYSGPFNIKGSAQYEDVAEDLKMCKSVQKQLDAVFKEPLDQAKATTKAIRDKLKEFKQPYENMEEVIKSALATYVLEIESSSAEVDLGDEFDPELAALASVSKTAPKVKGISYRDKWSFEVASMEDFLTAVLTGKVPAEAVTIKLNDSFLKKQAAKLGESLQYPGIRVIKGKSVVSSSS